MSVIKRLPSAFLVTTEAEKTRSKLGSGYRIPFHAGTRLFDIQSFIYWLIYRYIGAVNNVRHARGGEIEKV